MKHVQLFEDWHQGIEFGKPRNQVSDEKPKNVSPTLQKKIDKVLAKQDRLAAKWEKDKNLQVKVKKHVMGKVETVPAREAYQLLQDLVSFIRKRGDGNGTIVYI
jgi:hypothetical protein